VPPPQFELYKKVPDERAPIPNIGALSSGELELFWELELFLRKPKVDIG
jgi:hypothetical protein